MLLWLGCNLNRNTNLYYLAVTLTALSISYVLYLCIAQHVTLACHLKALTLRDSLSQHSSAKHALVSTLKALGLSFWIQINKILGKADAVSNWSQSQKAREGQALAIFSTAHMLWSIVDAAQQGWQTATCQLIADGLENCRGAERCASNLTVRRWVGTGSPADKLQLSWPSGLTDCWLAGNSRAADCSWANRARTELTDCRAPERVQLGSLLANWLSADELPMCSQIHSDREQVLPDFSIFNKCFLSVMGYASYRARLAVLISCWASPADCVAACWSNTEYIVHYALAMMSLNMKIMLRIVCSWRQWTHFPSKWGGKGTSERASLSRTFRTTHTAAGQGSNSTSAHHLSPWRRRQ